MYFRFVVIGSSGVGVILDHKDDEFGECVDWLEYSRRRRTTVRFVLDVAVDAYFGTDAEEER